MTSSIFNAVRKEYWRDHYWRDHETNEEHAERVTNAEQEAHWYFAKATATQQALFNQTMSDIAPYRNAPKWERMRGDAMRLWRSSTQEAAKLFERTAESFMATGECSAELDAEWTAMIDRNVQFAEAAE